MNEREAIINRDLHLLDEAHYSGRIARSEYRARRRNVLAALRDSHGITARNALVRPAGRAASPASGDEVLPALFGGRPPASWKLFVAFATGALLCAVLLYVLVAGA